MKVKKFLKGIGLTALLGTAALAVLKVAQGFFTKK
jgi:hypothetical protein